MLSIATHIRVIVHF